MPATSEFKNAENVTMFETPNGKNLKIIKVANTSMFGIRFHEGGELPAALQGMWTDVNLAQKEVKKYIDAKELEAAKKTTKVK